MSNRPAGTARIEIATCDSTMAEAARLAATTPTPFWVRSDTQTAGRGRRGRAWVPGLGNFYASLALTPPAEASASAQRSFTAALALADTLSTLGVPEADVALKWPNDVLLGGRKLAGILLENTTAAGRPLLITGIGVNLATAPPPGALPPGAVAPTALADHGPTVTPAAFLDILAPAAAAWEHRLTAQGFAPVRTAWLARAARLGETITARLPREEVTGRFETLDPSGAIVLDTPSGRRTLAAAEIHF